APEVVPEPLLQVAAGFGADVAADALALDLAAEAARPGEVAQDRLALEQRRLAVLQPRHLAELHLRLDRVPLVEADAAVLERDPLVLEEQPDRLAEPPEREVGQDRNGHSLEVPSARRGGALHI